MHFVDLKRLNKRFKVYRYAFFTPLTFIDKPLRKYLLLYKHKWLKKQVVRFFSPLEAVFKFILNCKLLELMFLYYTVFGIF